MSRKHRTSTRQNRKVLAFAENLLKEFGMQKVCRLCLQTVRRTVTPLFRDDVNDDECRQLRLQIADLCSIVILQDDSLPKFICCECKVKLQDAHEFVNLCKRSNDKLHEHYEGDEHQTKDATSLKGKKQKVGRKRKRKGAARSSKSARGSLGTCPEISVSLEDCNPTLLQNALNTEAAKAESDDADECDLNFKSHETPLKKRAQLNAGDCCDEPSDNGKKQYLCDVCSKTFASMSGLRFHLKSHYGSKPYICQFCDKSFVIPSYKKRHERTHMGDKLFICHICSTAFASSNGLKYHLRTHTGEANYHCSTCGKSFARYKYLKEHTFTHTGEKPFVCKLCGSAYGNSGSLFVHEKKCKLRHACDSQKDASKASAVMIMV
ncbi:hypothetical protein DMN91_010851 [Ooceraea biroi]|uniref:Zinc finger protein n=1 Tax=Ooceraea biroi TaxID=2015173 RepID=A0A026WV64_OOCBI|nr:myoneurin [Ooceraea biroi]EZA58994.1 hypothetical protein X777_16954 [Ooceraea biroi]RLU16783.1 hypothetical protein DMN91_010851 [Ooceraea biroi]